MDRTYKNNSSILFVPDLLIQAGKETAQIFPVNRINVKSSYS